MFEEFVGEEATYYVLDSHRPYDLNNVQNESVSGGGGGGGFGFISVQKKTELFDKSLKAIDILPGLFRTKVNPKELWSQ